MAVTFETLNPNAPIFRELMSNPPSWWERFVRDPSLYIEIRKDNQINVYFEGGSIARIHYCSKKHQLQVFTHHRDLGHPKPSKGSLYEECSSYISQIIDEVIERVKKVYSQKHDVNGIIDKEKWSEKFIQGSLIVNTRDIHLDSEFAYIDENSDNRIDYVRCDRGVIAFVEIKRMNDGRMLHETDEAPEIVEQMKRYRHFIHKYSDEILAYYQKLYDIKKSLKLPVPAVRPTSISQEPLLVIFDCWEKETKNREIHRKRVKSILDREGIVYSVFSELLTQQEYAYIKS